MANGLLKKLYAPSDMTVGTPWKSILTFTMPMLIGNIAQQLYIRYGFKPTSLIKDYYKNDQEDAIKMVKRIRPKINGN